MALMSYGDYDTYDYFSIKYLKGFSLENVYPSWTVLYIGIAIAGLTAPISGFYLIGKLSVIYGF